MTNEGDTPSAAQHEVEIEEVSIGKLDPFPIVLQWLRPSQPGERRWSERPGDATARAGVDSSQAAAWMAKVIGAANGIRETESSGRFSGTVSIPGVLGRRAIMKLSRLYRFADLGGCLQTGGTQFGIEPVLRQQILVSS